MSLQDDVLYLSLLLVSIALGRVSQVIFPENVFARRRFSTACGLAILWAVSGVHALHCLACFGVQVVLLRLVDWRSVHVASLACQFAHLTFFRLAHVIAPTSFSPPPPQTNAIQMILTLKMIGVAFEVNKSQQMTISGDDVGKSTLDRKYRYVNPTATDVFHYGFSHIGLLTGPYYSYRTFNDLYTKTYSSHANCVGACFSRLSRLPMYLGLFLAVGHFFPLKAVKEDTYYETTGVLWRIIYMAPVFFTFRMRLYSGFVLSECSCIMAGLGAYPSRTEPKPGNGPSKLGILEEMEVAGDLTKEPFDFETVHNIDEWGAETVGTMRAALRTWNMTVQFWLVEVVYRRLPPAFNRDMRAVIVMVVSSVWHGVHAGYYLSMLSVPLVLLVEDLYAKIVRKKLSEKDQKLYDWCSWFLRMTQFSYLGMAFQLLAIDATLQFWYSVYFIGHAILLVLYIAGITLVKPLLKTKKNQDDGTKMHTKAE